VASARPVPTASAKVLQKKQQDPCRIRRIAQTIFEISYARRMNCLNKIDINAEIKAVIGATAGRPI
jgi:hypothetical protein